MQNKCLLREKNEPSLCNPDILDSPTPAPQSSDGHVRWKRASGWLRDKTLARQGEEQDSRRQGLGGAVCFQDYLVGSAFALH